MKISPFKIPTIDYSMISSLQKKPTVKIELLMDLVATSNFMPCPEAKGMNKPKFKIHKHN
jgi:hypothetical protein